MDARVTITHQAMVIAELAKELEAAKQQIASLQHHGSAQRKNADHLKSQESSSTEPQLREKTKNKA